MGELGKEIFFLGIAALKIRKSPNFSLRREKSQPLCSTWTSNSSRGSSVLFSAQTSSSQHPLTSPSHFSSQNLGGFRAAHPWKCSAAAKRFCKADSNHSWRMILTEWRTILINTFTLSLGGIRLDVLISRSSFQSQNQPREMLLVVAPEPSSVCQAGALRLQPLEALGVQKFWHPPNPRRGFPGTKQILAGKDKILSLAPALKRALTAPGRNFSTQGLKNGS